MYLDQRTTPNTTAHSILASHTTNISGAEQDPLQSGIEFVSRYLQICLQWVQWIVRWSCQEIAALWRILRIADLLHAVWLIVLQVLKWCGIVLATTIGVTIIVEIACWGLSKLLQVYSEGRRMRLQEERQNEERKRHAAYLNEVRTRQAAEAAEAAAMEEARVRQAREEQTVRDKLKENEEKRQKKVRADYMSWEKECERVFRDRTSMTRFPFPPLLRCAVPDCPEFLQNPVPACQHNVKQFFGGSDNFSLEYLKRQRHLWHEDRFASCREDRRQEFKRLANSLFVVLDQWYETLKVKQTSSSSIG